jgi:hypothetical protein
MTLRELSHNDWIRAATLAQMGPGQVRPQHSGRRTLAESLRSVRAG